MGLLSLLSSPASSFVPHTESIQHTGIIRRRRRWGGGGGGGEHLVLIDVNYLPTSGRGGKAWQEKVHRVIETHPPLASVPLPRSPENRCMPPAGSAPCASPSVHWVIFKQRKKCNHISPTTSHDTLNESPDEKWTCLSSNPSSPPPKQTPSFSLGQGAGAIRNSTLHCQK